MPKQIKDKEELRTEHLKDTEKIAEKPRCGLFSLPPPLCVGDTNFFIEKKPKKNEQGKPITEPTNFKAGFTGKNKPNFFSVMGSISVGDPYMDPARKERQYQLEKKKLIRNDNQFKPASGYKTIVKLPYEHKSDLDPKTQVKNFRSADGRVQVPERNIFTNPSFKGLYKFPGPVKDREDLYDSLRIHENVKSTKQIFCKQQIREQNKKYEKEAKFKPTSSVSALFGNDKVTYGLDKEIKKKPQKETKLNIYPHETKFKPSGQNSSGLFPPLPQKPEEKKEITRQRESDQKRDSEKKREDIKLGFAAELARPTPSIAYSKINVNREMKLKMIS